MNDKSREDLSRLEEKLSHAIRRRDLTEKERSDLERAHTSIMFALLGEFELAHEETVDLAAATREYRANKDMTMAELENKLWPNKRPGDKRRRQRVD